MYYQIDERMARSANEMNSMREYRENSATNEYRAAVDKAADLVASQKAKVSTYYHDKLDSLLDRYARRLAEWMNAYNRNRASCPSVLVSGAGNFPVNKKNKQNAREDSLWQEYKEIEAILDKIKGVGTGGVDLADPHARELLQEQLKKDQDLLEYCKAANAYYRKHKNLRGYANLTDKDADLLVDPQNFAIRLYGKPFADYELTSIRSKIKRIEARLEELDKRQSGAMAEGWAFDGGEVVMNTTENRLQIIFEEKPDDETRSTLKSNGFRWAPSQGAWQRQLTDNAINVCQRIFPRPAHTNEEEQK